MNCFQAAPDNDYDSDNSDNVQVFLPAVMRVVPQALMVIVVFSLCIVWGSQVIQWVGQRLHLNCSSGKLIVRRRYLPPVIAVLKLFFLLYVTLRLNGLTGLQWKQQTSALCAALILVACEVVDVFAIAHTWISSRLQGVSVHDWREEGEDITAKQLILTFFDRWKDCGLVTSFLSQSEMTLLIAEIPSMAWASWTCCQRGATPEHISYQLHRWLTVLTIVMGMNVVLVSAEVENHIAGAVIFLVADVVLTMLKLFEGRHRRKAQRENVRAQRLTMITIAADTKSTSEIDNDKDDSDSDSDNDSSDTSKVDSVGGSTERITQAFVTPQRNPPTRSDSVLKQCWNLKRRGVWKSTVIHGIPTKEWVYAIVDCIYSVSVVFNFFETVEGSKLQIMPELLPDIEEGEDELMSEVNRVSMIVSSAFWTLLGLSLAGRHYFLYSSRRQRIPGVPHYFPVNEAAASRKPNYFAISVEVVKVMLLPVSICTCTYVLVQVDWYVFKQGVNVLVAGAIGAIAAARSIDAVSRALYGLGRFDGDPPGLEMFGGSPYVKASTALQVFWDRFNDFLGPLSLDHLLISSTSASKNFIVVYFLLCVCVLYAVIAYVDAINIKDTMYRAERLGYLVAVTFLVRNSEKYVERQGSDLFAPVVLVVIEFFAQVAAIFSQWKVWRSKRKADSAERESRHVPMLSSMSELDEWHVLSSSEAQNYEIQSQEMQNGTTASHCASPSNSAVFRRINSA
ncbi:hypothetical protein PHMEG_00019180 [Phytophthora megakarya]|uniref:Transmembrane protein n=1 Tax=Phytophthora megakarya TaxID=4795 RepID=A0A225VUS3_9STRA|nr:hypothetical protein PHMEG_00019180 [Phytophthora megakarya]